MKKITLHILVITFLETLKSNQMKNLLTNKLAWKKNPIEMLATFAFLFFLFQIANWKSTGPCTKNG